MERENDFSTPHHAPVIFRPKAKSGVDTWKMIYNGFRHPEAVHVKPAEPGAGR